MNFILYKLLQITTNYLKLIFSGLYDQILIVRPNT